MEEREKRDQQVAVVVVVVDWVACLIARLPSAACRLNTFSSYFQLLLLLLNLLLPSFFTLVQAPTQRQQQNGSRGYQQHAAQFGHCESNNNDGNVSVANVDVDAAVAAAADNLSAAGANASLSAADQSVAMRSEMRARGKWERGSEGTSALLDLRSALQVRHEAF